MNPIELNKVIFLSGEATLMEKEEFTQQLKNERAIWIASLFLGIIITATILLMEENNNYEKEQ